MKRVLIGHVGVDSGTLMVADPSYIDHSWIKREPNDADFGHTVYRNKSDGKLWQYVYGAEPIIPNVNKFPGSYETIIPEYGMKPNELVAQDLWEKTDIDPRPHIQSGEFSSIGIFKTLDESPISCAELNFTAGIGGAGVAFRSGLGDGRYPVYAEFTELKGWGKRISRIVIDFELNDEEE